MGGHLLLVLLGANARQGCRDRRHTTPINMIDVQVDVDEKEEEAGAFSLLRHPHPAETSMATASWHVWCAALQACGCGWGGFSNE